MSRLEFLIAVVKNHEANNQLEVAPPNVDPLHWADTVLLVKEIIKLRLRKVLNNE